MKRTLTILALVAVIFSVGLELGTSLLPIPAPDVDALAAEGNAMLGDEDVPEPDYGRLVASAGEPSKPPGLAIPALALLDILWMVVLIGLVSQRVVRGPRQALFTGIAALIVLILSIVAIVVAFVLVSIMLALFLSIPFGTLIYLAVWGFFARPVAAGILGATLFFKLGGAACLYIADPWRLRNRTLLLLILTSLGLNLLVAFLHGLLPIILVSIIDAVATIIVGIVTAIWALVYFVRNIIAFVTASAAEASTVATGAGSKLGS